MNRRRLLMAAVLLTQAAVASAFGGTTVRADVPFPFYAGEVRFPAGRYLFTVDAPGDPGLVAIHSQNGREHEMLLTIPDRQSVALPTDTKLVFDRYGKDSFLSQIWVAGLPEVRAVPKGEIARERAALATHQGPLTVPGHVGE
jgi:hypothetical protein